MPTFWWKFSPVLAQDTLAALLKEFFERWAPGMECYRFHYLNDVLVVSKDRVKPEEMASRLVEFLSEKGLVISKKSCPVLHKQILWPGKVFDLERGGVVNTEKMLRKRLMACSPISPKVEERVTGKMQRACLWRWALQHARRRIRTCHRGRTVRGGTSPRVPRGNLGRL